MPENAFPFFFYDLSVIIRLEETDFNIYIISIELERWKNSSFLVSLCCQFGDITLQSGNIVH